MQADGSWVGVALDHDAAESFRLQLQEDQHASMYSARTKLTGKSGCVFSKTWCCSRHRKPYYEQKKWQQKEVTAGEPQGGEGQGAQPSVRPHASMKGTGCDMCIKFTMP